MSKKETDYYYYKRKNGILADEIRRTCKEIRKLKDLILKESVRKLEVAEKALEWATEYEKKRDGDGRKCLNDPEFVNPYGITYEAAVNYFKKP